MVSHGDYQNIVFNGEIHERIREPRHPQYAQLTAKQISHLREIENGLFFSTNRIGESLGGARAALAVICQCFIQIPKCVRKIANDHLRFI